MLATSAAMLIGALAGCSSPAPFFCDDDSTCDGGTCVEGFCAFVDDACDSGLRFHESAGKGLANTCVAASGDTQDDPLRLADADLDTSGAGDDFRASCSDGTGRDVFFETTLPGRGRLYVDTRDTDFPVVLSVHRGACRQLGPELACIKDTCSDTFQQFTQILDAGTYCIVADSLDDTRGSNLHIHAGFGPDAPLAEPGQNTGDTCTADEVGATCGADGAPEQSWFVMSCAPKTFHITSCPAADFDGVLVAFGLDGGELACSDNVCSAGITVALPRGGGAWVAAEAVSSSGNDCGSVTVDFGP